MSSKKKLRKRREEARQKRKMELWRKGFKFVFTGLCASKSGARVFQSADYTVKWLETKLEDEDEGLVHLAVQRHDRLPIDWNHWRTLQKIKNELVGEDHDAVVIHPKEEFLIDMANTYHLWCFPSSFDLEIGFRTSRKVCEPNDISTDIDGFVLGGASSRQRPGAESAWSEEEYSTYHKQQVEIVKTYQGGLNEEEVA